MIFYVIFGDFVGWDWGTPPYCNKNTLGKIESKFGIGRPPPSVGTKDQIFPMIRFEGSPDCCSKNVKSVKVEENHFDKMTSGGDCTSGQCTGSQVTGGSQHTRLTWLS